MRSFPKGTSADAADVGPLLSVVYMSEQLSDQTITTYLQA
jgi:hypothetical protein